MPCWLESLSPYERSVLADLSTSRAMEHVRWLTSHTPYRISGGGQDREAARYVGEVMRECGLEVEWEEFPAYGSFPGSASLEVLSPAPRPIACAPCAHVVSTPPGGAEYVLVNGGAGSEADLAGKDVRGKAVLVQVSYAPPTPEKARLAAAAGAAALILMNWGTPDQTALPMRALKAVWGNPTSETFPLIPQLSGVSVGRADGEWLRQLLDSGAEVRVRLAVSCTREWVRLIQPLGMLRGRAPGDEFLLVAGHLDAWEPGVTCNATGNGVMLELARVLAAHREGLGRTVVFAFWNGHEIAEAAGSTWFLDTHWDRVSRDCVAHLNIDSPGLRGANRYAAASTWEMKDFHLEVEREVLGVETSHLTLGRVGDQSFFGVGIPSLAGRFRFPEDDLQHTGGATLGWWNHTREDTLDKADERLLTLELAVNAAYVLRLARKPLLPFSFASYVEKLEGALTELASWDDGRLHLGSLVRQAEELRGKALTLDRLIRDWTGTRACGSHGQAGEGSPADDPAWTDTRVLALNRCLMRLSRHLSPLLYTVAGRYGQDSYGLSSLASPIPSLQGVRHLAALTARTDEYETLFTDLVRRRNRASDFLYAALEEVDRVISRRRAGAPEAVRKKSEQVRAR